MTNRTRNQIILSILKAAERGVSINRLMTAANLNSVQYRTYAPPLKERGLISIEKNRTSTIVTTLKEGKDFIRSYETFQSTVYI
jgi:predicted transcriptional regulator